MASVMKEPRYFDETTDQLTAQRARAVCRDMGRTLNAFVEVLGVDVLGSAGPMTDRQSQGRLSGVPIAVKDMVAINGRAATLGLAHAPGPLAIGSAEVITRLTDAGAEIVAVTQMTPLAFEPSGANPQRGRPLNPWNFQHICGGSSSGSAVAVASGCVPLAVGSDTAGSLRIPAHCCGITAWKPTYGLVPIGGTMPLAPSLDTIGFLARSAVQITPAAKLFAELFSGTKEIQPIRHLAVARDVVMLACPDTIRAATAMEEAMAALGLSHVTIALQPLLSAIDPVVLRLLQAEAARSNADLIAASAVDAALAERLVKGLAITDSQLDDDRAFLHALSKAERARLFANADAILLPVMPGQTPRVSQCEPSSPEFSGRTLYELSRFTRFVNALGWPAVTLPAGFDGNWLPIGMQLVGPPGSDLALLALAGDIQATSAWHNRVPSCLL
jgi:Asp-tRNA(Asn)/Glu-tRNA(Gln) amidotransferase A subunit family amidase